MKIPQGDLVPDELTHFSHYSKDKHYIKAKLEDVMTAVKKLADNLNYFRHQRE